MNRVEKLFDELKDAIRDEVRDEVRTEFAEHLQTILGGGKPVAEKPRRARRVTAAALTPRAKGRPCGCGPKGRHRRDCSRPKSDDEERPAELAAEAPELEPVEPDEDLEEELDFDDPEAKPKGMPPAWAFASAQKSKEKPHANRRAAIAKHAEAMKTRLERYDKNRSLVRCTEPGCDVKVLDKDSEKLGHARRAHGGKAVRFEAVGASAA